MKTKEGFRTLLKFADAEFRRINRNRDLTTADKKLLKAFFLEHIVGPRARKAQSRDRVHPKGVQSVAGQRLLTAPQVEAWLQIDVKTIYSYAKRNLIPHIRVGSAVRFPEKAVQTWLEQLSFYPESPAETTAKRTR